MKNDSEYENIAVVVLGDRSRSQDDNEAEADTEGTSEASVLKALQEKYDTMKDKLMVEVSCHIKKYKGVSLTPT